MGCAASARHRERTLTCAAWSTARPGGPVRPLTPQLASSGAGEPAAGAVAGGVDTCSVATLALVLALG